LALFRSWLSSESDVTRRTRQQHHYLTDNVGRRALGGCFSRHSKQRHQAWHVKPWYYITKCARDGYHIRVSSRGVYAPTTPPLYTISPYVGAGSPWKQRASYHQAEYCKGSQHQQSSRGPRSTCTAWCIERATPAASSRVSCPLRACSQCRSCK
jgi:hypothetical protein